MEAHGWLKRPYWTDVYRIAGVFVIEPLAWERGNFSAIATVKDAQLLRPGNFFAETYAAGAQDTPLGVEYHVRPQVHNLGLTHLLFLKAAAVQAVLHVVVLQATFASLITDWAIQRMIDE